MLFMNSNGTLIEINKCDFKDDLEYYKTISAIYDIKYIPKKKNMKQKIIDFILK
jgi:hypothetical protein